MYRSFVNWGCISTVSLCFYILDNEAELNKIIWRVVVVLCSPNLCQNKQFVHRGLYLVEAETNDLQSSNFEQNAVQY